MVDIIKKQEAPTGTMSTATKKTGHPWTFGENNDWRGEPIPITDAHPTKVECSMGFTASTGDLEFVRGHVSITVPCDHADVDKAAEWAKHWVDDKLGTLHEDMVAIGDPETTT